MYVFYIVPFVRPHQNTPCGGPLFWRVKLHAHPACTTISNDEVVQQLLQGVDKMRTRTVDRLKCGLLPVDLTFFLGPHWSFLGHF